MKDVIRNYIHAAGPVGIKSIIREVRKQVPNLPGPFELDNQIESILAQLICEKQIELWIDHVDNFGEEIRVCFNIYTGEV